MKILISFTLLLLSFTANAIGYSGQFNPITNTLIWRADVFKVVCGPLASKVRANIKEDLSIQTPIQYMLIQSGGVNTPSTFDPNDGKDPTSPFISSPVYGQVAYVYVQNSPGALTNIEFYNGQIECKKPDGTNASTSISLIQDQ